MLNKWRYVDYTDDGCSIFECLYCHYKWESRTTPKDWKWCPVCGVKWDGEQPNRLQFTSRYPSSPQYKKYPPASFVVMRRVKHNYPKNAKWSEWSVFDTLYWENSGPEPRFKKAYNKLKRIRKLEEEHKNSILEEEGGIEWYEPSEYKLAINK